MKTMFAIKGNISGERIRLARHMHKPPLTQDALAKKLQLAGIDITKIIISRIEKNERHVIDYELHMIAKTLGVSMDWLVGDTDNPSRQ